MRLGRGVAKGRIIKSSLSVYKYTDMDNLIVRPLAPPQTHTSDRPIFKNSFDSENSGKLMRHYVAISLIFAF